MNVEQFNALYPVGTPVIAYPGARPEDIPSARRIASRTRTKAQRVGSLDREGVVWVEDHGAYIALTHIDVIDEQTWEEARDREALSSAPESSDDWDDKTWAAWSRHAERVHSAEAGKAKADRQLQQARDWAVALENETARLNAELKKYVGEEPTRDEEMAYLSRCLDAVLAVCDQAEKQATRWANPLPVPEWVETVRKAVEGDARELLDIDTDQARGN